MTAEPIHNKWNLYPVLKSEQNKVYTSLQLHFYDMQDLNGASAILHDLAERGLPPSKNNFFFFQWRGVRFIIGSSVQVKYNDNSFQLVLLCYICTENSYFPVNVGVNMHLDNLVKSIVYIQIWDVHVFTWVSLIDTINIQYVKTPHTHDQNTKYQKTQSTCWHPVFPSYFMHNTEWISYI